MNNNKKPSEPAEEERWVKIEKEVQELKRSRSILSIGLFLLSGLYGILILCIILRIIRIEDTLTSIIQFNALVGEHDNFLLLALHAFFSLPFRGLLLCDTLKQRQPAAHERQEAVRFRRIAPYGAWTRQPERPHV